jgi:hypothetical protein
MNLRKLNLGLVALLLGFGLVMTQSAFKPAATNKAPLHWYKVSYDDPSTYPNGYIKSDLDYYVEAEKESVLSPCVVDDEIDCLRGFEDELIVFPNSGVTSQVIMTTEN